LNTAGEAMPGEPPVPRDQRRQKTEKKVEREGVEIDFLAPFRDMSSGDRIKKMGIAAAFLVVLAAIFQFLMAPKKDPLVERGKFVAKAFLDKDEERLRNAAYQDTGEDAVLWMQKGRAKYGVKGSSGDFLITVDIIDGGLKDGGATVFANLDPRSASAVGPPEPETPKKGQKAEPAQSTSVPLLLNVPMKLVIGREGEWLIDGRQSLSMMTAKH
jgi:hypothetical protein